MWPADIAQPHPLIHAARRQLQLPEPAVEEEVKDVPLYSIFGQKQGGALGRSMRKDRPHLKFEIERDDGFKIQADNWDGESKSWTMSQMLGRWVKIWDGGSKAGTVSRKLGR